MKLTTDMHIHSPHGAFTLVELILYVALVSVLMFFVTFFVAQMSYQMQGLDTNRRTESEMLFAIERIEREIQKSSGIDVSQSVFNTANSSLAIKNSAGGDDFIELSGNALRIRHLKGDTDILTSPDVPISTLTFVNRSLSNRPATVFMSVTPTKTNATFETAISYRAPLQAL